MTVMGEQEIADRMLEQASPRVRDAATGGAYSGGGGRSGEVRAVLACENKS
jgi:hypothetical protein